MKRSLIQKALLSIFLVIGSLVSSFSVRGQQIIRTTEGDTLITITPLQLRTINCIITDYEFSLKKEELLQKQNINLRHRLQLTDSLVLSQSLIVEKQREAYAKNIELMNQELKESNKKKLIIGGVGGVIIGVVLGILICK